MLSLQGKHIVLGVTAGIAAYKSPEIVRRLQDHGADVRVVMTPRSEEFITPLTLQSISRNVVEDDIFDRSLPDSLGHLGLGSWADLVVVAPATADFIARFRLGMGDDLLSCLCLSARCDIVIAPAMNQQMYASAATQSNLEILQKRNVLIWGPDSGYQACGDIGKGRMLNPNILEQKVIEYFSKKV